MKIINALKKLYIGSTVTYGSGKSITINDIAYDESLSYVLNFVVDKPVFDNKNEIDDLLFNSRFNSIKHEVDQYFDLHTTIHFCTKDGLLVAIKRNNWVMS